MPPDKPQTFYNVLEQIRKNSKDSSDLGTRFEKLLAEFFKKDSLYGLEFTDVKRWYDWYQEPDTGIDLVARDKNGNLVGIQSKCWADDSTLDLKDISTMFTTAKAKKIDKLYLVFTGGSITSHTQTRCEEAGVKIITKSDLASSNYNWGKSGKLRSTPLKLRPHQVEAVQRTVDGFQVADRGKLIMACGTGKTLVSLHIAERMVGIGGIVLYLVPSISLIPQTMREWADNRSMPHRYVAVCSDKTSGRDEEGSITEIPITPSTDADSLCKEYRHIDGKSMCVVFSTYNSVAVAAEALLQYDRNKMFDLILFDEAHKTTGAQGIKESYYLISHSNPSPAKKGVPAQKRLYMTATPRVYLRQKTRGKDELKVYSMDDTSTYGDTFYSLQFSEAVERDLLSEYKIIMREVDQGDVYGKFIKSANTSGENADDYGEIDLDYMAKLGGICKAITYPDGDDVPARPLQRIMVFHNLIKKSKIFAGHGLNMDVEKKPLKIDDVTKRALSFDNISERLFDTDSSLARYSTCTRHVDGSTNSRNRGIRIDWLRESDIDPYEIRILSNAKCLQEGVDVPALDAVAFMDPKRSPIDIIQSIGRVMRKPPPGKTKECGYVIIPIPVLKGDDPDKVLNRNRRYEQINQILRAILAHDDKLRAILNSQILSKTSPSKEHRPADQQEITPQLQEWIQNTITGNINDEILEEIKTALLELRDESYYTDVGEKLGEQAVIVEEMLRARDSNEPRTARIVDGLHRNLQIVVGRTVTRDHTVKALAQHTVMSRIFRELFPKSQNPVAVALDGILEKINIKPQMKSMETYYQVIKYDIEHFEGPEEKQEFIRIIYDSFFRGADKKASEKHGIVHTPVEIVNFIIQSVQYVLNTEFDKSFDDKRVKILDPFTGTGIFISQLLESGMISQDNLYAKYKNDIYANELMLPAYYVTAANIETTYHRIRKESKKHVSFDGVTFLDTLDQHPSYRLDKIYRQKQAQLDNPDLQEAHSRTRRQGMDEINVIMGNPPYSAGQSNYNDQNQNISYPEIDTRIADTYIDKLKSINPKLGAKNSMYDSYIRSIRWASDRIGKSGVVGFVTNASFIRSEVAAGLRACLADEFTDVWVFDLRGNARTQGEERKKEAGNAFGGGSRAPVAITILVKNPGKKSHTIHYYDIGDYHSREKKLDIISTADSIAGIKSWQEIKPDMHHDWLDQRTGNFTEYLPMGSKDAKAGRGHAVFGTYANGVKTKRDVWVYNSSEEELTKNVSRHLDYCNKQNWDNPVIDPKKAKWSGEISATLKKFGKQKFSTNKIRTALYRPFFKQYLYLDKILNQTPTIGFKFFPKNDSENLAIVMPYKSTPNFSTIMTNRVPDLNVITRRSMLPSQN